MAPVAMPLSAPTSNLKVFAGALCALTPAVKNAAAIKIMDTTNFERFFMMIKGFMFIYSVKTNNQNVYFTGKCHLTLLNSQMLMFVKFHVVKISCKYPAYRVMVTRTFKSKFAIH
jgi:hypothetical protein